MIRLITFALALFISSTASAQTYPTADSLKGFHPEVYMAAAEAHKLAVEALAEQPKLIATMKASEPELRKALEEKKDFARLAPILARYLSSTEIMRTTSDELFDRTIIVTLVANRRHSGDRVKTNLLIDWLKQTQAFQEKYDGLTPRADRELINAAIKRYKELYEKSKKK